MRLAFRSFLVVAVSLAPLSCGGSRPKPPLRPGGLTIRPGTEGTMPKATKAPQCITGRLVTSGQVCGLGVAGPAYFWDDPTMRDLAKRRAARNLAGMMQTIVNSAMVTEATNDNVAVEFERYMEVPEDLVDSIYESADHEIWYDLKGSGPFRDPARTYDCACVSPAKLRLKVDPRQADKHGLARQYSINKVPEWVKNPSIENRSLRCAVGQHGNMFHPEEVYGPLTDSVRAHLGQGLETWILSEFTEDTICGGRAGADCESAIKQVVEAANKGISKGVLLTAIWIDRKGIHGEKKTAYGWGCVFDKQLLDRAKEAIKSLRASR